jgi:hypothetical protein
MAVRKAGKAWDISYHSTLEDSPIIIAPTIISTGAVAAFGTAAKSGLKNKLNKK